MATSPHSSDFPMFEQDHDTNTKDNLFVSKKVSYMFINNVYKISVPLYLPP